MQAVRKLNRQKFFQFLFFLGFHSNIYNGIKEVRVSIAVDRLDSNGNVDANFKSYHKITTNKDDNSNFRFKIDVPKTGSFAITATVDGVDCFTYTDGSCPEIDQGHVCYRAVETMYNAEEIPSVIDLYPKLAYTY